MLKICTDTYKIIDKNIPLLTIRLGGKPCERLGGRGAGWLAGGRAGLGVCGCGRAVGLVGGSRGGRGSLGSGATRPWLLPWPPRWLPPPAEEKSRSLTISFNWTHIGCFWSVKAQYFTDECLYFFFIRFFLEGIGADYAPR